MHAHAIEMRPRASDGTRARWVTAAQDRSALSLGALTSSLELLACATHSDLCGLVVESEPAPRWIGRPAEAPSDEQLRAWLTAAAGAEGAGLVKLTDGSHLAALRSDDGTFVGALALRPNGSPAHAWLRDVVGAAGRHLLCLLDGADGEVAAGYEALVEIGAQLQEAEIDADAVLELIVQRARSLCRTDVAWLALVDDADEWVRVTAVDGASQESFRTMAVRVGTGIGGAAVAKRRPILVRNRDLYDNNWPASVPRALADEGVVSVLCAPMLRGGRMVGALYLGSRRPTPFGAQVTDLLTALATQAAIAVENARLYRALGEQNQTLERSAQIHRLLTDASLDGGGVDAICAELALLCDAPVTVLATADEPDTGVNLPIVAGDDNLGWLHADGDGALNDLQRRALEHGATVIALELVKERAAREVEQRLQGELLEELLRCGPEPTPGIRARAEHAGVDLGVPRRVVALEPRGEGSLPYLMQLARADPATLMARRDDLLVLAVTDEGLEPTEAAVTALHRRAARAGIACRAGISDAHTDLAAALREAEAALGLAVADRDETAIVSAGSLGPMRFLLDARDTTQMTALVRRLLAPLADYDRVHQRATLLPTLRHYLEFDGRQLPAAEACHIHVSTLKYRMRRIAAVLPRPLHDPDMRFELRIAYAILDVLERLGEDPLGAA